MTVHAIVRTIASNGEGTREDLDTPARRHRTSAVAKSKVYEFEIATACPDDQVDFELARQVLRERWEVDGRIVTGEKIDANDPTLVNVANVDEVSDRSKPA